MGLLLMSKCLLMQKKNKEAQRYAEKAKQVYPAEAQAYHISGFAKLSNNQYEGAFEDFSTYDKRLPGDPNTTFYQGLSLEGMEKKQDAAKAYNAYLKRVTQGQQAQYAAKTAEGVGLRQVVPAMGSFLNLNRSIPITISMLIDNAQTIHFTHDREERHVVLVAPEIHWNTGNIGRTCLGAGAQLHLIQPLGFSLDSRQVKRAGLDYWDRVSLDLWDSFDAFENALNPSDDEVALFTKKGSRIFWDMSVQPRMFLIFGSETGGLPEDIISRYPDARFRIPMTGDIRSLNLSTAAGIALYESLRSVPMA